MADAYEFVDGATSDLAFVARGSTVEEAFSASARALLAATVEDSTSVRPRERRSLALEEPDLELLLLRFLNELVYLRDAEELLLLPDQLIVERNGKARLRAELAGERIDRRRHALAAEVKAATAHALRVARCDEGWIASVTLDV
jgi:SHS2 domain-containing protein